MKLVKLLFLYFLSLAGFLCYGDTFSKGTVNYWISENLNNYLNDKLITVIDQQGNELTNEIKMGVLQINPEQIGIVDVQGINEIEMVGPYKELEMIVVGVLPSAENVFADSMQLVNAVRDIPEFTNMGVAIFHTATVPIEDIQEKIGEVAFTQDTTDYILASIKDKGLETDQIESQNLQFYAEPIGGGGGGSGVVLVSLESDFQNYFEALENTGIQSIQQW